MHLRVFPIILLMSGKRYTCTKEQKRKLMTFFSPDTPVTSLRRMVIAERSRLHLHRTILRCKRGALKWCISDYLKMNAYKPGINLARLKSNFQEYYMKEELITKDLRLSAPKETKRYSALAHSILK